MEKEYISIQMGQNTKANGRMIYNMVKVKKFGMMVQNILENITKEKSRDKVDMNGLMGHIMMENGKIIK